jgi:hypothetical protein
VISHLEEPVWYKSETYVLVLAVAGGAVSVVERLQYLRAENIGATRDVETSALVELCLIGRHFAVIPSETFGTNARQSLIVSILATSDKLQAEVDVLLLF